MADYQLSKKADEDLAEIYVFSYKRFGEARADAYLLALEQRFITLAGEPNPGRKIDHIQKEYFRYEHSSHSIFYKIRKGGVTAMRVLHNKMDTEQHV